MRFLGIGWLQADHLDDGSSEDNKGAAAADHESLGVGSADELEDDTAYEAMIKAVQGGLLLPSATPWVQCPMRPTRLALAKSRPGRLDDGLQVVGGSHLAVKLGPGCPVLVPVSPGCSCLVRQMHVKLLRLFQKSVVQLINLCSGPFLLQ